MTGSTFDKKWIIGLVLGFAVLVLLLILLFRKGDDNGTDTGSSNNKKDLGDKRVDPVVPKPDPTPSPTPTPAPVVESCFVPEKQKSSCMHLTKDDNMRDQIRCLQWRSDLINGGSCEELRMTYDDPSSSDGPSCGNCCNEYKALYDSSCGSKDPIIHDKNKDRNRYPCGQDCSDQLTVEKCYTDILNLHKCEFGSPTNSGSFLQNCESVANSNDLICNTEVQNACKNVLANGPALSLCKNKK